MTTAKPESFITPKSIIIILVCLFALLGLGLLIGGDPKPIQRLHRYPWQQRCDDRCATALGEAYMQKYDGEDCDLLRRDRQLYESILPEDIEYRMAAIGDRLTYENCK